MKDHFQCVECRYVTDKPSAWTEAKQVKDWDIIQREWLPVCPACNGLMRWLPPLSNALMDIAGGSHVSGHT
jgi:NAD-dependent SIR2 family protein deacetylase